MLLDDRPNIENSQDGSGSQGEVDRLNALYDAPSIADKERNATAKKIDDIDKYEEKLGKGFSGDDTSDEDNNEPSGKKSGLRRPSKFFLGSKRRKILTYGLTAAGISGIIASLLIAVSPLKILHITTNLQNHFFGVGEKAASDLGEHLLTSYLIKQVMPGMIDGLCQTTRVDKTCAVVATGSGPIAQTFNAWRDARLENKLANKYGVELMRMGSANDPNATFYLRTPSTGRSGVDLGTYNRLVNYDGNLWGEIDARDRNQIRRDVRLAFRDETLWKRMYYRHKVGKFLERKYGINRCVFACNWRDGSSDWIDQNINDRKKAGRGILTHIVAGRMQESTAIIFECAMSGFVCADYEDTASDGTRTTAYERDLRNRFILMRSSMDPESIRKLLSDVDVIKNNGLFVYLLDKLVNKILIKAGIQTTTIVVDASNPIGWAVAAVQILAGIQNAGPAIRYLSYMNIAGMYAAQFATYRTNVDEMKVSRTDATLLGSLTDTLSSEGGYTAEQSPLYQTLIPSSTITTTAMFNPKSFASTTTNILSEVCEEKPAQGELVCPNESLKSGPDSNIARGADFASMGLDKALDIAPLGFAARMGLENFTKVMNFLSSFVGSILDFIGADKLLTYISEKLGIDQLMKAALAFLANHVLQNPLADTPNSINNLHMLAGGADVIANDFARDDLGLGAVSDSVAMDSRNQYLQMQKEDFQKQSLYARLFDTENTYSAVSQFALAAPGIGSGSLQANVSTLITNPVSLLRPMIGSILSINKVSAGIANDPFGIQQYGISEDHPVFTTDPETYWEENNCGDPNQRRDWTDAEGHSYIDEASQQLIITQPNGCKLLSSVLTATGGMYDTSLIPSENSESNPSQTQPVSNGPITSDGWTWPIAGKSRSDISRDYGVQGCGSSCGTHKAIDLGAPRGTPVVAAHNGTVTQVRNMGSCGYVTLIKVSGISENLWMEYQHMDPEVSVNQTVTAGQRIGTVGKFCGSGYHLHFGISLRNSSNSYSSSIEYTMDPKLVLP